jgi:hypothetical protein
MTRSGRSARTACTTRPANTTPAGSGFVAHIKGEKSHSIIEQGLKILENLDHRGAVGADELMGDGAGILIQLPDEFYRAEMARRARRPTAASRAPAAARRIRRGHDLPAQGARVPPGLRTRTRARREGRRPGAAGLARGAGRPRHADVAHRARQGAGDPPDLHRPRRRRDRARRAGAQALRDPQDGVGGDPEAQAHAQPRVLRAQHELPHRHLQGPAAGQPGGPVLPRPGRPARRVGAGPGAPALLDQHLPRVAAGPPLPDGGAQRRDQHRQGQLQLDARARRRDEVAGAGRRPEEALPDQLRRPERHRHLRQRARADGDGRLPAGPRRDDDDPRGLGAARTDGRAPARLLRIPRRDARTLGRPGRDGLHRRQADRRHARPQRPAPHALHHHRRRRGRRRVGIRRAAHPREPHHQEVAPAARQDAADRPGAGPHHRRRGTEEPVRVGQALPAVDRERAHPARLDQGRRPAAAGLHRKPARPPAGLRLHAGRHQVPAGAHGHGRRRSHRLDGQRQPAGRAVGQEQAAVQLLQAAVRAGDQPADRPDPRSDRDVAEQLHRPQAQPAGHQRRQPADAARGRAAGARLPRHGAPALDREAHPRQVQEPHDRHHLPAGLGA